MAKRLGILAYRTKTGLGYQTLDYYNHLKPHKTLVVDLSPLNGVKQQMDWFEGEQTCIGFPDKNTINYFLNDLDVVLVAESPLNNYLFEAARKRGIRTVQVHNYEFFEYFTDPHFVKPNVFISPSMWNYKIVDKFAKAHGSEHYYLHHPVDRSVFKYVERDKVKFFHIAGRPAAQDRNGTYDFMNAYPNGVVATQNEQMARQIRSRYRHSNVFLGIEDATQLYHIGTVMVLPRKYGGNCLPLNEALSSGCPVIMPDVEPNNHLLPKEWLVPARFQSKFKPRAEVDMYQVDHKELRNKLEEFKAMDIKAQSQKANEIADSISWETLKPKFEEILYK